jgi:NRAMP (natural resistance-associated macrophage protein)-like metal ion transporter
MDQRQTDDVTDNTDTPMIPHSKPTSGSASSAIALKEGFSPVKRFLKMLGPGFITGASDDDPSGIGTYSAAGASLGYATLWTALLSFPLMSAVQFICARIGMVSGMGLSGILKRHYSRWLLYPAVFCLVIANTINAGADIGAIAAAFNLLVSIPIVVMIVPITLIILVIQVWGSYRLISNIFRWLALALLAYLITVFFAQPDPGAVLKATFLPTIHLNRAFLSTLVAILGTTISPYLFFWQTNEEVEEKIRLGRTSLQQRKGATRSELKFAAWDVNIGMLFSNLVMYTIILATAATLFKVGRHDIKSATEAAEALHPLAGNASSILFALGLISTGFLAVPILTGSAAYALSEALGWKYGLDKKPGRARQFYAIIIVATLVGMLMNFLGINPIAALFWTAVINGLLAPPLLILVMLVANNKKIMGDHVNKRWLNLLGWIATGVMFAAALIFVVTWGMSWL